LFDRPLARRSATIAGQGRRSSAQETAMAQIEKPPVAAATGSAPVLAMPIMAMARFRRLMNDEGWEVDLPRMCVDTAYAYQCLATAHTSSDLRLRQAALGLFEAYDRNTAAPLLH
jgi:hypothetical protein